MQVRGLTMVNDREIYIVLTNTGTVLANIISYCTKEHLSHVSISFDKELKEVYSFGRKYQRNPFVGGFIQENIMGYVFQRSECAVYRIKVTEINYQHIRSQVNHFIHYADRYRYNFLGMVAVYFNVPWDRGNYYFCSQFVSSILKNANIDLFDKDTTLVTPADFQNAQLELVYRGSLRSYLRAVEFDLTEQYKVSLS